MILSLTRRSSVKKFLAYDVERVLSPRQLKGPVASMSEARAPINDEVTRKSLFDPKSTSP
jgi:hypothetical protein